MFTSTYAFSIVWHRIAICLNRIVECASIYRVWSSENDRSFSCFFSTMAISSDHVRFSPPFTQEICFLFIEKSACFWSDAKNIPGREFNHSNTTSFDEHGTDAAIHSVTCSNQCFKGRITSFNENRQWYLTQFFFKKTFSFSFYTSESLFKEKTIQWRVMNLSSESSDPSW